MDKIRVFTKGRTGYEAKGIFENNILIVLKDSKLSNQIAKTLPVKVSQLRNNKDIVNENNILLRDISFNSASTAAGFVTGNISNGLRVWKLETGEELGDVVPGKMTKKKKEKR